MPGETFDGEIVILDASEAMSVVQLPIIEERFGILKQQISDAVEQALSLDCTEETVRDVKKARAALNKQFQMNYENARKKIKAQVMAPYNLFEELYKKNISELFEDADKKLSDKIGQVERELKERKKREAETYFNEYKASIGLSEEPFSWEDVGVAVNLSSTVKSLREAAKRYLDNVKSDLACIRSHEYADEILVEYYRSRNLATAISEIVGRHEAIEKERARREAAEREREEREARAAEIEKIIEEEKQNQVFEAPEVEPEPEQEEEETIYEVAFRVRGTLPQIVQLKAFLQDGGLDWEQIAV